MYKLLVVDDETKIADGIAHTIDWNSIGVRVVGSAACGLEALEKTHQHRPDIIITDVKMDNMDGLTLINEVNKLYPFVKFIVLSGYDEPEFIRKSLDLKVFSYLLKLAGEEELLAVVKQQLEEIEKEWLLREKIRLIDFELGRNRQFFIESFLDDLLNGRIEDTNELATRTEFLNIAFVQHSYCCVLFSILDVYPTIRDGGFHKLHGHYLAIEEIVKSAWEGEVWPVHLAQERLVVILGGEGVRRDLERIMESIKKFLGVPVVAATGEMCRHIEDIWKSYKQALLVYEGNSIPGLSGLISMDEMPGAQGLRFVYPVENRHQI